MPQKGSSQAMATSLTAGPTSASSSSSSAAVAAASSMTTGKRCDRWDEKSASNDEKVASNWALNVRVHALQCLSGINALAFWFAHKIGSLSLSLSRIELHSTELGWTALNRKRRPSKKREEAYLREVKLASETIKINPPQAGVWRSKHFESELPEDLENRPLN